MIRVRVAPALVEQTDELVALQPRERDTALVGHHLLGRVGVDASGHVPELTRAAPQALQDAVLLRAEARLEGTEMFSPG
jgi:hypothetical protein